MTDQQLDRVVRDADPYRPHYVQRVGEARQRLLEEIMAVPVTAGRPLARRYAAAVAAAAVTGVLAITTLIVHNRDDRAATAPSGQRAPVPAPTGPSPTSESTEQYPHLFIDEPGWKPTTAYGFTGRSGTITLAKGVLHLEMDWYPAEQYDSYDADRRDSAGSPTPVTVDGWQGSLFRLSADRFTVQLHPRDDIFVEVSTASDHWTRATFDRVLGRMRRVDAATWYAALPAQIITPARAARAAATALTGVPLPPRFSLSTLNDLGTNDQYHFVVAVTGRLGCAWIADWMQAHETGDRAAENKAADALRGSHQWKVLRRIAEQGGWSGIFWDTADKTASGHPPAGYEQTLGCQ